jgi:hypothetical protein
VVSIPPSTNADVIGGPVAFIRNPGSYPESCPLQRAERARYDAAFVTYGALR